MLICLSSGSRPRYKQDILRAIGMPINSQLQFRYDQSWVGDTVLQMIQNGRIKEQDAIIAYADQSDPGAQAIELVPVRLAQVISASLPGETVSLVFSVGKLCYASDLSAFNNEVSNLTGQALPRWVDGRPTGLYCTELSSRPTNFVETDELRQWEQVVAQLANRRDFDSEETFSTVLGLLTEVEVASMSANLQHRPWPLELPANAFRSILLYHFHPSRSPTDLTISAATGPQLHLESPTKVRLDSRYDLKKFLVRSGDPSFGKQGSWITLVTDGPGVTGPLEKEIGVQVRANWLKRVGIAALIGIGLAGGQIGPLVSRSDLGTKEMVGWGILILLFSLVVGAAAAWGLRRSV